MTAWTATWPTFPGPFSEPSGVSGTSQALDSLVANVASDLSPSILDDANVHGTLRELIDTFEECSIVNWDGYGARPLKLSALLEAWAFLQRLPAGLAKPSIVPEPTGDIGLEWSRGASKSFVVSFSGAGVIDYAGLLGGGSKTHGVARFHRSVPQELAQTLLQYFPPR